MIGARVVDQDDFVVVPPTHCLTDRTDGRPDVILLVEAGDNEAECRWGGHAGFGGEYCFAKMSWCAYAWCGPDRYTSRRREGPIDKILTNHESRTRSDTDFTNHFAP